MHHENQEEMALALGRLFRGSLAKASGVKATAPGNLDADATEGAWLLDTESRLTSSLRRLTPTSRSERSVAPHVRRILRSQLWYAGAAVAAIGLLSLSWPKLRPGSSLTYVVSDGSEAEGAARHSGRVVSTPSAPRTLTFSDGSELKLAQGGSLRVRETDEHGAEVVVERGTLTSSVIHRKKTSWSVFAGPYEIQVVGTKFSTQWDPDHQKLLVELDEGSVQVVGADILDHVAVKPGQRFEVSPHSPWRVSAKSPPEAPLPSVHALGPEAGIALDPEASPTTAAPEPKQPRPSANWEALLADGKFVLVMEEAKKSGVDSCLRECSIERLRSLADAARYTGDLGVARQALLSLRKRAPSEAARAGYFLGSLSEARGQAASSLAWYRGYLTEAPHGALAAEARAGKMRALHALGQRQDAQRAATEYLRMHPSGASAATALRILEMK